jgi:hypothetical protein
VALSVNANGSGEAKSLQLQGHAEDGGSLYVVNVDIYLQTHAALQPKDQDPHIMRSFSTTPVLGYPQSGERFIVDTDASNVGIGGVLSPSAGWSRASDYLF